MNMYRCIRLLVSAVVLVVFWDTPGHTRHGELPNRIPEAAPYNVTEAEAYPPPYEDKWTTINNPMLCASCHTQIFQEWNGSMMANSWRDPFGGSPAFPIVPSLPNLPATSVNTRAM